MGTKLPLFGYYDPDASGAQVTRVFRADGTRKVQLNSLHNFMQYVARADVQALRYYIIANEFDVCHDEWSREVIRESGGARRSELVKLLNTIAGQGTIVVPTIDDLIEHKSKAVANVVERILEERVTVLEIFNFKSPLVRFADGKCPADRRVFEAMADNVLQVRSFLEDCFAKREFWSVPVDD